MSQILSEKSWDGDITKFNFCSVFRGAWLNAILPTNVIAGFRKSVVYSFNRDAVLKSADNLLIISEATVGMLGEDR